MRYAISHIRKGFESQGGVCVFTSEWDKYSQQTYHANFRDNRPVQGDITEISETDIPDHDILLAGFPCQPFSIAGVSKKNSLGRVHGFACETQGTLFFDVARIIKEKRPAAFMLENVKNLLSHDGGRTFQIILKTLTQELGYEVHYKVIDAQHFVPQHRERIIIVGFREQTDFAWDQLNLTQLAGNGFEELNVMSSTQTVIMMPLAAHSLYILSKVGLYAQNAISWLVAAPVGM